MIDRVGNGNTYTPPYARGGKKAARIEGDAPAFLLPGEDQNGGVIWDRGSKEDIPKPAAQSRKKEERIPPKEEEKITEAVVEEEYKQSGFGKLLGRIGQAIKNFFLSLWYGGEKEETGKAASDKADEAVNAAEFEAAGLSADDLSPDGAEEGAEPAGNASAEVHADVSAGGDDATRAERIRSAIAANDPDALMEELTEGGKKHPAKNTSLLTHYDRRGRLVRPSDAEAGRILTAESTKKGKSGRNVERRPQGNYRRYI